MTAQLGNRGFINGDTRRRKIPERPLREISRAVAIKAVTEFAGTDEGNIALRRDRALVVGVAGKRKSRSASVKMKPPWAMP